MKIHIHISVLNALVAAVLWSQPAQALSEQEAVVRGIMYGNDFVNVTVKRTQDSLDYVLTHAGWVPTLSLGANGTYQSPNAPLVNAEASGTITQVIPGGGKLSAGVKQSLTQQTESALKSHSTGFSAGIVQPLLKGAWNFGAQDINIALAHINNTKSLLTAQKGVLSTMSAVRKQYWECINQNAVCRISRNQLTYSQKNAQLQRQRFALGSASELDTLTATLQFLKTSKDLLSSENKFKVAKRQLAFTLHIPADSISIDSTAETILCGELPSSQEFIASVKKLDPTYTSITLLKQELDIAIAKGNNQLLPQLDLNAGISYGFWGDTIFKSQSISNNFSVGASLKYDIPNIAQHISIRKTTLDKEQNKRNEAVREEELLRDIDNYLESWSLLKQQLEMSAISRTIAKRKLDAAQKGYELGRTDQLTLIQSENDYAAETKFYFDQMLSLKTLEITIDEITGTTFSRFGVSW